MNTNESPFDISNGGESRLLPYELLYVLWERRGIKYPEQYGVLLVDFIGE